MRYVLGDLHGNHKALTQLLGKVNFDYESDELIFLGDLSDGYPEPDKCLQTLLRVKNLYPIWGNHDIWLSGWLNNKVHYQFRKIPSFEHTISIFQDKKDELEYYFSKCMPYCVLDGIFYTHGGFNHNRLIVKQRHLNFSINRKLYELAKSYEIQKRRIKVIYDEKNSLSIKEIFIGHTPTVSKKPDFVSNLINIDTGAGNGGKLTLMEVASKKYWQSTPGKKLYA